MTSSQTAKQRRRRATAVTDRSTTPLRGRSLPLTTRATDVAPHFPPSPTCRHPNGRSTLPPRLPLLPPVRAARLPARTLLRGTFATKKMTSMEQCAPRLLCIYCTSRVNPKARRMHRRRRTWGTFATKKEDLDCFLVFWSISRIIQFTDGSYTKGTRAHTHREVIREWLWEPKGSSLEYI